MRYEFAGSLFRTEAEMLEAVVSDWVTAGGVAPDEDVADYLDSFSDADAVGDMLEAGWPVDASRDNLIAAMAAYRARRGGGPGEGEEGEDG
jgi:hypothetical protein